MTSFAEVKCLKEEIAKKGSMLVKLKEDKMKRKPGEAADKSPNRTSADREKEELKKTIKKLEGRLNTINAAEKPLEEGQEDPDQDVLEKQVQI